MSDSGHDLAVGEFETAQSLEPASFSVSPSLSAPPLIALCLSLSLIINIKKIFLTKTIKLRGEIIGESFWLGVEGRAF